jgi:hypothetical protein
MAYSLKTLNSTKSVSAKSCNENATNDPVNSKCFEAN